jgi:acetone carboxylase gamma subunit
LECWTGIQISEELANDMMKWATFSRILRASKNSPRLESFVDNTVEKVDLELMLCMVAKDSIERILSVQEVMGEKVSSCEAVIALNQLHLYLSLVYEVDD